MSLSHDLIAKRRLSQELWILHLTLSICLIVNLLRLFLLHHDLLHHVLLLCVVALRPHAIIFKEFLIVHNILHLALASLTVLVSLESHTLSRLVTPTGILLGQ